MYNFQPPQQRHANKHSSMNHKQEKMQSIDRNCSWGSPNVVFSRQRCLLVILDMFKKLKETTSIELKENMKKDLSQIKNINWKKNRNYGKEPNRNSAVGRYK